MSLHIIDLIKGQLGPALVSQVASQLGESESGIGKAISGFLPVIIAGLAKNSDNPAVTGAITNPASSGILGNLLQGTIDNPTITGLISTIFGDHARGVVNTVAKNSGISDFSANSVMNLVAGASVGTLGKYAADNNLGASDITTLLNDQKSIVSSLLPAGLSLASFNMGAENWFESAKVNIDRGLDTAKGNIESTVSTAKDNIADKAAQIREELNEENGGSGSMWKWLLPLLFLGLISFFLWKQCNKKDSQGTTTTTDSTMVSETDTVATTTVDSDTTAMAETEIDLNGVKLKGYDNGMEDKMIEFLKSGGYTNAADDAALKETWYDFDKVNFKMGSAKELEAGSQEQVENLITILKAFPDAKIKIGGYTDKTGNEASNKKLSQERADFIKAALSKAGVGAQVLGAQGYGSEYAKVAATASDAERASDRKMAVRFAK